MATVRVTLEFDTVTGISGIVDPSDSGRLLTRADGVVADAYIMPHVIGVESPADGNIRHRCAGGKTCVVYDGVHYCV
jgi:hypothetical protein